MTICCQFDNLLKFRKCHFKRAGNELIDKGRIKEVANPSSAVISTDRWSPAVSFQPLVHLWNSTSAAAVSSPPQGIKNELAGREGSEGGRGTGRESCSGWWKKNIGRADSGELGCEMKTQTTVQSTYTWEETQCWSFFQILNYKPEKSRQKISLLSSWKFVSPPTPHVVVFSTPGLPWPLSLHFNIRIKQHESFQRSLIVLEVVPGCGMAWLKRLGNAEQHYQIPERGEISRASPGKARARVGPPLLPSLPPSRDFALRGVEDGEKRIRAAKVREVVRGPRSESESILSMYWFVVPYHIAGRGAVVVKALRLIKVSSNGRTNKAFKAFSENNSELGFRPFRVRTCALVYFLSKFL